MHTPIAPSPAPLAPGGAAAEVGLPKLPAGIGPMPDEMRQHIKFLATHVAGAYSGGGWQAQHIERCAVVSIKSGQSLLLVNPNFTAPGTGLLLDFVAAMDPETALATLAYVEWLEATNRYLTDSTVSQHVYTTTTDSYVAALDAATARAEAAEQKLAGLLALCESEAPDRRGPHGAKASYLFSGWRALGRNEQRSVFAEYLQAPSPGRGDNAKGVAGE